MGMANFYGAITIMSQFFWLSFLTQSFPLLINRTHPLVNLFAMKQ